MDMSSTWHDKLHVTNPEIRLLVTIGLGRLSEIRIMGHPATWGRVLRASTHQGVDVESTSGLSYPFWPTVKNWPNLAYVFEPELLQVSETSTSVELMGNAPYVRKFFKEGHPQNCWMRIDAWMPGIKLEQVIPLFAGPITGVNYETDQGSVTLSSVDKLDGIELEIPTSNDFLELSEVPELPEELAGRVKRFFVLNEIRDFIPLYPISKDRREYYVCEPALESMPTELWAGSVQVKSGKFKFRRDNFASSGQEFTKLTLEDRIEAMGYAPPLYARGGSGPNTVNPMRFFIDRQPGLELTPRATAAVENLDREKIFDYYAVISGKANVISIIKDRLMPQSDMIGFFRGGKLDVIKYGNSARIHNMVLGGELKYRLTNNTPETSSDAVYNAADVQYRRIYQSEGKFSRFAKLVDKGTGGAIGRLLARSEALYGRRFIEIPASDLGNSRDAERLGIAKLTQWAFRHRRFSYHVDYRYALKLDLNDRARLTDPQAGANEVMCRITEMVFLPTGMNITLQTEDAA